VVYYDLVKTEHPDKCVKMIPVGRLISRALQMSPFNEIEVDHLYEDNAPHGRPSIYFMAAMISYMASYEEMPPMSYEPTGFVDPIIAENYQLLNQFFWNELLAFNEDDGTSKVFCNTISNTVELNNNSSYNPAPNPTSEYFSLDGLNEEVKISLYSTSGLLLKSGTLKNSDELFKLYDIPSGIITVKVQNPSTYKSEFYKLVKI